MGLNIIYSGLLKNFDYRLLKKISEARRANGWSVGVMEYWIIGSEPITPPLQYSNPDEGERAHPSTMLRAIGI
jgi:hypothetical protein